ncbi:hypothetical protein B0T09DRAFT_331553, partial [Sordaria sp. MPI-SDFR-AT-0083]
MYLLPFVLLPSQIWDLSLSLCLTYLSSPDTDRYLCCTTHFSVVDCVGLPTLARRNQFHWRKAVTSWSDLALSII